MRRNIVRAVCFTLIALGIMLLIAALTTELIWFLSEPSSITCNIVYGCIDKGISDVDIKVFEDGSFMITGCMAGYPCE